jgi:hypothetical protein
VTGNRARALIGDVIGGIPLLAYPFVLLANVMTLAAGQVHFPKNVKETAFIYVMVAYTVYPVIWGGCLYLSRRAFARGEEPSGIGYSFLPVAFAASILLGLWAAFGGR